MARGKYLWVDDMLDGRKVSFPDETVWELEKKISETSILNNPFIDESEQVPEAKAVYLCKQIMGPHVGSQAIIKVHVQYVFPSMFSLLLQRSVVN
jgi:hypothetical protein